MKYKGKSRRRSRDMLEFKVKSSEFEVGGCYILYSLTIYKNTLHFILLTPNFTLHLCLSTGYLSQNLSSASPPWPT